MSNKLEDLEKSLALAECINMMKVPILMIDLDYLGEMSVAFYQQASFEESAAVLNQNFSQIKCDLIRKQAKTLSLLKEYILSLKEIDELKLKVGQEQSARNEISKLFL